LSPSSACCSAEAITVAFIFFPPAVRAREAFAGARFFVAARFGVSFLFFMIDRYSGIRLLLSFRN
jgi:hypothetical protein